MQALASKRLSRISILIISALVLAGCGKGDGPESIAGTPATPLPPIPEGLCDAIGFETLCESPIIINFNGGATTIIDNPDVGGINVSEKVAQMQKFADEVFGGTKLDLAEAIDFAAGEFYKVKVWSPRPVVVSFKLEETGNPGGGLTKDVGHSGSGTWEELCFDFTGQAVPPPVVALTIIFDNGDLGQAAVDPGNWTFYYDDIEQVSSCAGDGDGGAVAIDPDAALYSTAGDPDLVIPDDYAELTPFGSGSIIDAFYADDNTYSPVLAVTSGIGYNANIAQIGYIGFVAGFAGAYETLDFKVKGMPNQVLFVKLFDDVDALRINLTSSTFSGSLGSGWFQVSIPISSFAGVDQATGIVFESDNAAPAQFTMFLSDIGFSGTGDNPPPGGADPGIIPDDVIYATDPGEAVDLAATVSAFGTTSQFDGAYALDADFNPAFEVISGTGYGIPHIAQLGLVGLPAGFATDYESFSFKIKSDDLPGNLITVKLEAGGAYGDVVLTDATVSTSLGNGWYQVVLPMSDFANVDPAVGVVFEAQDQNTGFSFLLTDIGFNNPAGGGGADPGIIPEDVIYATDPGEVIDLVATVSAFGTTSQFDGAYALDADFNPAFEVVSGTGYGIPHIAQLGLVDLPVGFATGYGSFSFKIKSDDLPGNLITVKLEAGGAYGNVVLTDATVSTPLGNGWYQVVLPMSDFANVDPAVGVVFEAQDQNTGFSFLLTDIGFSGVAGGGGNGSCPPVGAELATNGDFEAGDLSCWEVIPNGGTITADNTENNGGAWSAHVVTAGASNPTLKQNFLAEGTVAINDIIDISFDMKGTAAAGGIIFPKLISEGAGGSDGPILQTIDIPTADWTTYTYSPTITADVTRGITFEISVVCGAVAGCTADVFIDNVTVQIR